MRCGTWIVSEQSSKAYRRLNLSTCASARDVRRHRTSPGGSFSDSSGSTRLTTIPAPLRHAESIRQHDRTLLRVGAASCQVVQFLIAQTPSPLASGRPGRMETHGQRKRLAEPVPCLGGVEITFQLFACDMRNYRYVRILNMQWITLD